MLHFVQHDRTLSQHTHSVILSETQCSEESLSPIFRQVLPSGIHLLD